MGSDAKKHEIPLMYMGISDPANLLKAVEAASKCHLMQQVTVNERHKIRMKQSIPSLCVILVCRALRPVTAASAGLATTLTIVAMPSSPTNFSKSTKPALLLLTFSMHNPE